jgi:hypothetical protein
VFAVLAGVQLAGLSADAFADGAVRVAFVEATAAALSVSPASVAITSVTDVTAAGRRRLTQQQTALLDVRYQVFLLSAAAAAGVSTRIVAAGGGPTLAALQSAGVAVTGVVATTPPSVSFLLAPPAPAPPPPSPAPPAGCGATWLCFAGVECATSSSCAACPVGTAGDGRSCTPCALRVAIAPSFAGGASPRASDVTLAGVVSANEGGSLCSAGSGFTFAWSSNATTAAGAPLLLPAASSPSLMLPARSLGAGQMAAFTLTACVAGASSSSAACGASTLAFAVTPAPLVALIGGGDGVVGEGPLLLSSAASFDPDGTPGAAPLVYAWACVRTDASSGNLPCAARDGTPVALGAAATQALQLQGAAAPGATYVITMTVSQGDRASTASTALTVLPGMLPHAAIQGSAALSPGAKASPSAQLLLLANVTAFVPGPVVTRWALVAQSVAGPLLNLSDAVVAATPVTSVSMVLLPGALAAGARYVFSLTATDAAGAVGVANASVQVSSAARGGWADVTPASGVALSTSFLLTAAGWTADADELPLMYAADYIVAGSGAPPVSLTGGSFQSSPVIAAQLPAGLPGAGNIVTLRLSVRTAFGATVSANASVAVTWPTFSDASAATAFVDGVTGAAVAAMQSGDASSALQAVGGLTALLNSNGAAGRGTAEPAQRASLLTIVASVVSQQRQVTAGGASSSSAAVVESAAALVSALVSKPAQLTAGGAVSALVVLGSIASAGAAVSPAAAQSVADALSSVALAPAAAAAPVDFGAVMAVLNSLAASQAAGLQVAGQAPAMVSTPVLQMAVSLDAPEDSPRLFATPLSAPGSNASFAPLPRGALKNADGAPVRTTFMYLAFDPFTGAAGGTGVVRLAFSTADTGASIAVQNLTAPITFSMPPLQLLDDAGEQQQATCKYWDEGAGAYASDGCTSMPSPAPASHWLDVSWRANLTLATSASIAAAWVASGPLLEGCTEVLLDCSNVMERARSVQLNPDNPFAAPSVSCGGATSGVLHVFHGTACRVYRADNAAACAWDAAKQAFAGAGCVVANVTRCACTHLTSFAGQPAPKIAVCSADDLLNLSPADLVTRLQLLFCIVVGLFGAMHIGALVGYAQDRSERAALLAHLMSSDMGFEQQPCGAWTWAFTQPSLLDDVGLVPGNMTLLARAVGMPFSRLRCAIPPELLDGITAQLVGRRAGLSVQATKERVASSFHCCRRASASAADAEEGEALACLGRSRAPKHGAIPSWSTPSSARLSFVAHEGDVRKAASTALMFAVLSMRALVPEFEVCVYVCVCVCAASITRRRPFSCMLACR